MNQIDIESWNQKRFYLQISDEIIELFTQLASHSQLVCIEERERFYVHRSGLCLVCCMFKAYWSEWRCYNRHSSLKTVFVQFYFSAYQITMKYVRNNYSHFFKPKNKRVNSNFIKKLDLERFCENGCCRMFVVLPDEFSVWNFCLLWPEKTVLCEDCLTTQLN